MTWHSRDQDGDGEGVYGQLYDAAGDPVGGEFRVNTTTADHQQYPSAAALADGGFVVTWHSADLDGFGDDVYGQQYDASGTAAGAEFLVNTTTADRRAMPRWPGSRVAGSS